MQVGNDVRIAVRDMSHVVHDAHGLVLSFEADPGSLAQPNEVQLLVRVGEPPHNGMYHIVHDRATAVPGGHEE